MDEQKTTHVTPAFINRRPVVRKSHKHAFGKVVPFSRKQPPRAGPLSSQEIDELTLDRLFKTAEAMSAGCGNDLWSREIITICNTGGSIERNLRTMSDSHCANHFSSVTFCNDTPQALRYAMICDGSNSLLAIDIDLHSKKDETVSELLSLRKQKPNLAILIMSRAFAYTDLSSDRTLIADASLKLPATETQLLTALFATAANSLDRFEG
jgi:hypothetical protein